MNNAQPIRNVPGLEQQGAAPFGSPPIVYVQATTLAATGNFPARPVGPGPSTPAIFAWPVTAAAVNTQTARANPTAAGITQDGYLPGDVVGVFSTAALVSAVHLVDGNGTVTRASLGTTATDSAAFMQWNGTDWIWYPMGSVNVT